MPMSPEYAKSIEKHIKDRYKKFKKALKSRAFLEMAFCRPKTYRAGRKKTVKSIVGGLK